MDKQYITLAEYEAYREKLDFDSPNRGWKTIEERERMENELLEMYKRLMPEVGMGATELLFSDRRAKTVVEVLTPNKIIVRENEVRCKDYYAGNYEILDELSNMPAETFTRRKSGQWVAMGQPDKYTSTRLVLGYRYHYIDPSF